MIINNNTEIMIIYTASFFNVSSNFKYSVNAKTTTSVINKTMFLIPNLLKNALLTAWCFDFKILAR